MRQPDRRAQEGRPAPPGWIPFCAAAGVLVGLCAWGAQWGDAGAHPLLLPFWERIPAGGFMLVYGSIWVTGILVMLLLPRHLNHARLRWTILLLSLACRLVLLPHPPSDDVNRYLWEGRLLREGIDPYRFAPNDPALAGLAAGDPWHAGINHPDHAAIYPPGSIGLFALVGGIRYTPMAVKLTMVAFDLGTLILLYALLNHRGLSLRWSLLYAVNPVALFGFAGRGHLDALLLFCLCAAIVLHDRRQWGWMFLLLGLSVQTKYMSMVAVPFFIRRESRRWLPAGVIAALLPFLPFVDHDPARIWRPLVRFGADFAFNGSFHALMRHWMGTTRPAAALSLLALSLLLIFGWIRFHPDRNPRHRNDPVSGCFFALGALILFLPTIHFWYLSWVLPFLALRPSAAWTLLCLTIAGYFVTLGYQHESGAWHLPPAWQMLEWLPFWLLLAREGYLFLCRIRIEVPAHPPETVSVVMPVLNEAERVSSCIAAVRRERHVVEVIVVDGGSTDGTADLARKVGARVIRHHAPPDRGGGRGGQIRAGVAAACGDVVTVVHADCHPPPGTHAAIMRVLRRQPMVAGGAVGGVFDGRGWHLRLLEAANDFRAACMGIAFGDQMQFFHREMLMQAGGFPDLPLMEDVELSLRLARLGRQVYLFGEVAVSDRRWRRRSAQRAGLVVRLCMGYLLRRLFGQVVDAISMYKKYYKC